MHSNKAERATNKSEAQTCRVKKSLTKREEDYLNYAIQSINSLFAIISMQNSVLILYLSLISK